MKQGNNQTVVRNWLHPKIVLIVFLVFMLVLIAQFTYLSLSTIVYGDNLKLFAKNRTTQTKELIAKRGTIYDSTGNVLAINVTSYTLIAYLEPSRTTNSNRPNHVMDIERTAKELAEVLDAPYEYMLSRLEKEGVYQVEFGKYGSRLTELTKLSIEELELPGLSFIESSKRFYPNGSFASYIIGYAKTDENGNIVGELGVERKFNNILKGTNGSLRFQRDLSGYQIPDTPEYRVPAEDGSDIYLTIDSTIQRFLETAVKDIASKYTPEWTVMVVMDAKTGEILGSATTPSFDPNNLPSQLSYQNPLISEAYEPGSTMKIFTYLCAMDTGKFDAEKTYLSGSMRVSNQTVRDWRPEGWGWISYHRGFILSSNVGAMNVAKEYLSAANLRECFERLGFASKTGIELTNEVSGSMNFNPNIEIDWLSTTFGQGMSVNAVQILQALTVIANDGVMVKPHIVKKTVDGKTGEVTETPIVRSEQLFSKEAAVGMRNLMFDAVNMQGAIGTRYMIEGFDLIGKTGTAQIFENGAYLRGDHNLLLSFAGMYPRDNPEIIVYVAVKKPTVNSSLIIANPLKDVIKNIAKYRNMYVNHEPNTSIVYHNVAYYINEDVKTVKKSLENKGLKPLVIGDGNTIINQFPMKGTKVVTGDRVFLITNGAEVKLESIIGWARNDVERYMLLLGIKYKINGFGYVVEQSLPVHTIIDNKTVLEVTLGNKFNLDEREE